MKLRRPPATIRAHLQRAYRTIAVLLLVSGALGWWITFTQARSADDTLRRAARDAELTAHFAAELMRAQHAATTYLHTRDPAVATRFREASPRARQAAAEMIGDQGAGEEAYLLTVTAGDLLLLEATYLRIQRLASQGDTAEVRREIVLMRPMVDALQTRLGELGAARARRLEAARVQLRAQTRLLAWSGFLLVALALGVTLAISRIVQRAISTPLEWLTRHAASLGRGEFQDRTEPGDLPGEFAEVATGLNRAGEELERLAATEEALHERELERERHEMAAVVARFEAQLAQAQLSALQLQLQPHFLFNALNSLSALMHRDVDAADHLLRRLGDLLRIALKRAFDPMISLEEEVAFLESYVEIEQTRFGGRLAFSVEVDPAASNLEIPHLLLQPLVENALRHGFPRGATHGVIAVRATLLADERLHLEVEDNGSGLPEGWSLERAGTGLRNTQMRLSHIYPTGFQLSVEPRPGGGVLATVDVPARARRRVDQAAEEVALRGTLSG
jgi:signal transduction histidine kinase